MSPLTLGESSCSSPAAEEGRPDLRGAFWEAPSQVPRLRVLVLVPDLIQLRCQSADCAALRPPRRPGVEPGPRASTLQGCTGSPRRAPSAAGRPRTELGQPRNRRRTFTAAACFCRKTAPGTRQVARGRERPGSLPGSLPGCRAQALRPRWDSVRFGASAASGRLASVTKVRQVCLVVFLRTAEMLLKGNVRNGTVPEKGLYLPGGRDRSGAGGSWAGR